MDAPRLLQMVHAQESLKGPAHFSRCHDGQFYAVALCLCSTVLLSELFLVVFSWVAP